MRRHKIVAQIILLFLSVINFVLAAPVLVRGIREVRVDVAEATASWKRWNPSDTWWANAADRTNTPPSLGSSDSDYRLEQELKPHDPRSPPMDIDLNDTPQPSQEPTDSYPLPVGSPAPARNNPPSDIDLNLAPQPSQEPTGLDNSHPLPVGPSAPARNKLPLDIDLNHAPQASQEPTDSDNSHLLPVGPPAPTHNNLPLNIDLNAIPQASQELTDNSHPTGPLAPVHNLPLDIDLNAAPQASNSDNSHHLPLDIDLNAIPQASQELTDSSDSGSHWPESSTDEHDSTSPSMHSNSHAASPESSSDVTMSPSAWYEISVYEFPKSPSQDRPHRLDNLDVDLNRPLSPGSSDYKHPAPPSDPGSSKRPYSPPDPGPSKRPYRPSDPGPSTWAYPPSVPKTEDPGPSTWAYSPPDPGQSTRPHPLSDPATSDPGPSTGPYPASGPRPSTSDPGPSTRPPPASDPGLSTPPSPGLLQHESENVLSELVKGRLKRRISGSRGPFL